MINRKSIVAFSDELSKIASSKKYRQRVEVYAVRNGRLLSGTYDDGSIGTYGGGVDPGESVTDAAKREFNEESGYKLRHVGRLPVGSFTSKWTPEEPKKDDRQKRFVGSRTTFLYGVPDPSPAGSKDRVDPFTAFSDVRWKNLGTAIRQQERAAANAEGTSRKRMLHRLDVLNALKDKFGSK